MGALVQRHDPDRYFTVLLAPPEHRETLFTLYAFNHELARARDAAREPMAALIRLQWWREVIEGARRRHEVAGPLGDALDAGRLDPARLATLVDAREAETAPVETLAEFQAYVQGTAGGLMAAAASALGMEGAEALRRPGAAYGTAGILRSIAALARQGRHVLPGDLLAEAGLGTPAVLGGAEIASVRARLATMALTWLEDVPAIPRKAVAAALPLAYARRDLKRAAVPGPRPLSDRIAVLVAAATGRP